MDERRLITTSGTESATAFDERVSRLAQYRPFDDGGIGQQGCLCDLTIVAAMENGGSFDSLGECREGFRVLWEYEVEIDELRAAVDSLVERSLARRRGGGFALTPTCVAELRQTARESTEREARAFDAWRTRLVERWSHLRSSDFEALCQDFPAWLGRVVARHGAEAALLLYTEKPRAAALLDRLDSLSFDFLPPRTGLVQEIREPAFQMFVREAGEDQRAYLARRLNIGFYLTVLTVDPEVGDIVRKKVNGHRVYLDTNFLYAVLGMARATEVYSAGRLLELTRNMGFQLAVTQWTLDELRTSLARSRRKLEDRALPRRELADLMLKGTGEKGFERAFWIRYRDKGTSPKDFFDRVSHLETLLKEHDIERVNVSCDQIAAQGRLIGEHAAMYDRVMASHDKEEIVVEHDVKHRLLVERLRGDGNLTFTNARYWFLTQHARLMRYAALDLGGKRVGLPFSVTASAWAQAIRFLTPRTADVDSMIVDLFSSPYVGYRSPVNPSAVDAVVSRIDEYAETDVELGAEVLADGALVHEIALATSVEEASEQARLALDSKAQELRDHARVSAEGEAEAREAQRKAEELAATAAREAASLARSRDEVAQELEERRHHEESLESALTSERREREQTKAELGADAANERSQRLAVEKRVADLEAKAAAGALRRRVGLGIAAILAMIAGAVVVVATEIAAGTWPITGVVVGLIAGVGVVLVLAWDRERAGRAVLTAFAIVAGVMAIYAAVEAIFT